MKNWAITGLCLVAFTGSALAQQPMAGDELKAFVAGKSIELSDGIAAYKADGKYEYWVRGNGQTFRGKWSVQGDRVCCSFDNGNSRCDQYLKEGSKISLRNSQGKLFPVVSVK